MPRSRRLDIKLAAADLKHILKAVSWRVETAPPVIAKVHKPGKAKADPLHGLFEATVDGKPAIVEYEPDSDLRDTEQVPLLEDGGIEAFIRREVLPYTPDAWIKEDATKIGYEVSFTRHFYKPQPLRTLGEISADILAIEKEAEGLLDGLLKGERHDRRPQAVLRIQGLGTAWLGHIPSIGTSSAQSRCFTAWMTLKGRQRGTPDRFVRSRSRTPQIGYRHDVQGQVVHWLQTLLAGRPCHQQPLGVGWRSGSLEGSRHHQFCLRGVSGEVRRAFAAGLRSRGGTLISVSLELQVRSKGVWISRLQLTDVSFLTLRFIFRHLTSKQRSSDSSTTPTVASIDTSAQSGS